MIAGPLQTPHVSGATGAINHVPERQGMSTPGPPSCELGHGARDFHVCQRMSCQGADFFLIGHDLGRRTHLDHWSSCSGECRSGARCLGSRRPTRLPRRPSGRRREYRPDAQEDATRLRRVGTTRRAETLRRLRRLQELSDGGGARRPARQCASPQTDSSPELPQQPWRNGQDEHDGRDHECHASVHLPAGTVQDPGEHLCRHRLLEMAVEAGLAGRRDDQRPAQSGERHGEGLMEGREATQPFHELHPVEARHLEIAEDQRGLDFRDQMEGFFTILGRARPHAPKSGAVAPWLRVYRRRRPRRGRGHPVVP